MLLGGPLLEGAACWQGVETIPARADWAGVGVVALPAWVEHQPRRLLAPVAAGVPGVVTVPAGDAEALAEALAGILRLERSTESVAFAPADVQ